MLFIAILVAKILSLRRMAIVALAQSTGAKMLWLMAIVAFAQSIGTNAAPNSRGRTHPWLADVVVAIIMTMSSSFSLSTIAGTEATDSFGSCYVKVWSTAIKRKLVTVAQRSGLVAQKLREVHAKILEVRDEMNGMDEKLGKKVECETAKLKVSAELTNATNLAIELEAEKKKWAATGSDNFDEILRRLLAIRKRQLEDIKAINTLPLTSANREFISKNIKHIRQRIEERKALRK